MFIANENRTPLLSEQERILRSSEPCLTLPEASSGSRGLQPMLLTIQDVAPQLQVKPSTVYAWAAAGKIPCLKIHGLLQFNSDEIIQWVESFRRRPLFRIKTHVRPSRSRGDLDAITARVKMQAYNPRHGEARPTASPKGKEVDHGAR